LKTLPKISIVTPVYNNISFIRDCILSVLKQNYNNLEYIVIDGGSTDGTAQIIEEYADKLACFVSEKDHGQTHALNKGFAKATGEVLAWLNADEEYLPGTLLKVGKAFATTPDLDFYYGQRIVVDINKKEIRRTKLFPMHPRWYLLYRMCVLPTDTSFWSARSHKLTGMLDEKNFPKFGMDADWLLRLSANVKKWKHSNQYLSVYVERSDRMTRQGKKSDPNRLLKNHYLARNFFFERYPQWKMKLLIGWLLTGICCKAYERRAPKITINEMKRIVKKLGFLGK